MLLRRVAAPERRRARPRHGDGHVSAEEVLVGPAGEPRLGPDADAGGAGAGAGAGGGGDTAPDVDVGVLAGAHDVAAVGGVGRRDLAAGVLEPCQEETRVPFSGLYCGACAYGVLCDFERGKERGVGFAAIGELTFELLEDGDAVEYTDL